MLRRSQDVPLWDCRKRAAYTYKVATIRLLLKSSSDTGWAGADKICFTTVLLGAPRRPHDWRSAPYCELLVQRENHVDRGIDFHRFTVELCWLVLPLLHGVHRCANQQRMARDHFERFDRAALGNQSVKANSARDAG